MREYMHAEYAMDACELVVGASASASSLNRYSILISPNSMISHTVTGMYTHPPPSQRLPWLPAFPSGGATRGCRIPVAGEDRMAIGWRRCAGYCDVVARRNSGKWHRRYTQSAAVPTAHTPTHLVSQRLGPSSSRLQQLIRQLFRGFRCGTGAFLDGFRRILCSLPRGFCGGLDLLCMMMHQVQGPRLAKRDQ